MSLEHALKIAQANPNNDLPKMAALIYTKSKGLISVGLNSKRTHPLQARFGKNEKAICLHAEIAAIVNAKSSVAGSTMYVARVGSKGEPRLAKPCAGCQRAIIAFQINKVFWTETLEQKECK